MKIRLILVIILGLTSCTKKESSDLELISYYWSMKTDLPNDTLIPYVRCDFYAQINRNGDCTLTRVRNYESDLFLKFKIKREIIDSVLQIVDKISSDTVMTRKCYDCIYDGPTIKLIGRNTNGVTRGIRFNHSDRSNIHLLNLYNYIDSTSKRLTTTDKFMKSKEDRIKEIYDKDIKSIPVFRQDYEVIEEK